VAREAIVHDFAGHHSTDLAHKIAEAIWAWGRGIAAVALSRGAPGCGPQRETLESAVEGLEALIIGR